MSYSIQYGPNEPPKPKTRQQTHIAWLIAAVLIPTLLLTMGRIPKETADLTEALFPWEQEYVREALSVFSDSIRSGNSFKDAVTTLCTQILDGEGSAQ